MVKFVLAVAVAVSMLAVDARAQEQQGVAFGAIGIRLETGGGILLTSYHPRPHSPWRVLVGGSLGLAKGKMPHFSDPRPGAYMSVLLGVIASNGGVAISIGSSGTGQDWGQDIGGLVFVDVGGVLVGCTVPRQWPWHNGEPKGTRTGILIGKRF